MFEKVLLSAITFVFGFVVALDLVSEEYEKRAVKAGCGYYETQTRQGPFQWKARDD